MESSTRDTFFDGRLIIKQSREGYRFSIDAILLAGAVVPRSGDTVLDLGTGSAIIPLILALRHPDIHIKAVEIQEELAALAAKNVIANRMERQIEIMHTDMRCLPADNLAGPFDWVVSNPPYRRPHSGRINPNEQRAVARHEISVDLAQVLACTRRMLRTAGHFAIIYPAERAIDLFGAMRENGIEPKWVRTVHSRKGEEAKLILVRGIKGGRPGVRISMPLSVYGPDGSYTQAVSAMMTP